MAAGNLVVKLLLESNAFNTNIKNAKAKIQSFENVGKNIGSAISSTLGKMAAGIGIATSAIELFQTAINSSVGGTQAFQTAVDVAKSSVDNFFYSLTTGDFSAFASGMDVVIKKAKEAKNALLDVQYSQMAGGYVAAQLRSDYDTYMQKAKNPLLPIADRQEYGNKAIQKTEEFEQLVKGQTDLIINAVTALAAKDVPFTNESVNIPMLTELAQKVAMQGREATLNEFKPKMDEYQRTIEQLIGTNFSREEWTTFLDGLDFWLKEFGGAIGLAISGASNTQIGERFNEWVYQTIGVKNIKESQLDNISKITQQYAPYVVGTSLLNNKSQEQVDEIFKQLTQLGTLNSQLASWKQGTNELSSLFTTPTINNGGTALTGNKGGTTTGNKEVIYPTDSVKGLQVAIAKAKEVRDSINAMEDPLGFRQANDEVAKLENRLQHVLNMLQEPNFEDSSWFEPMEFDIKPVNAISNDNIKKNYEYADSIAYLTNILQSASNAFASFDNRTEANAATMLAWAASTASAVGTAIQAIKELIAAKGAEAAANAGAEASKVPVVGWLMAGAAIASVLASFASIPKFANGGIVSSPFSSGDKVLARVNGGEMILNKGQQANLFNILDKGVGVGSGQVSFKISGKELVGVLNNYNNRRNKAI